MSTAMPLPSATMPSGRGSRGLHLVDLLENVVVGNIERAQRLGGDALAFFGEREQQVLGAHLGATLSERLLLGDRHRLARPIGESV